MHPLQAAERLLCCAPGLLQGHLEWKVLLLPDALLLLLLPLAHAALWLVLMGGMLHLQLLLLELHQQILQQFGFQGVPCPAWLPW